jgi:hypothetical protein
MDRKDIIRMIANLDPIRDAGLASLSIETLERFSALIAAAEREECAKLLEDDPYIIYWQECVDAIRARGQS